MAAAVHQQKHGGGRRHVGTDAAGVLPGTLRKRGALVRDVIADALCGPNGCFATRLPVLASHTAPFREMTGRADYGAPCASATRSARASDSGGDLRAVVQLAAARWALAWRRVDAVGGPRAAPPPLRVAEFESAPGRMRSLSGLRADDRAGRGLPPRGLDASQDACESFEARVREAHGAVASAVVADARSEWTLPADFQDESCPTVVFALELLDNLPHDKVRDGFEGWVVDGREDFRPAADSWVQRALALEPVAGDAFVPTGRLQFSGRSSSVPRPRLFLADFSELPRPGATPRRRTRRSWPPDRDLDASAKRGR